MTVKFEAYEGSNGKFYWYLRRADGQAIAGDGPYATKDAADKAIKLVKANAPDAEVVHLQAPPKPLTAAELAHEVAAVGGGMQRVDSCAEPANSGAVRS